MSRKYMQLFFWAILLVGFLAFTQTTKGQSVTPQGNPTPSPLTNPLYNYSESDSCTSCHFVMGPNGDHNPEAVGVRFDTASNAFVFTGGGWRASRHAQSNYNSTQNTYCAKCHSPIQATVQSSYKNNIFKNTDPVPDGAMEGVTCASCHPSHTVAAQLGRRLGIYQIGQDKNTAAAYQVVPQGQEDQLCLNCHITRHNTDNAAFSLMYAGGVRCVDCHMAVYGKILGTQVDKRFHDYKVAQNLPYSCGLGGSVSGCHPGFSVDSALKIIPMIKGQHSDWFPLKNGKHTNSLTAADYKTIWQQLDAQGR